MGRPETVRVTVDLPRDVVDFWTEVNGTDVAGGLLRLFKQDVTKTMDGWKAETSIEPDVQRALKDFFGGRSKKQWDRDNGRDRWPWTDAGKPRDVAHAKRLARRRGHYSRRRYNAMLAKAGIPRR